MPKTHPIIIGLTGGIGSGKTAVSDWFAKQGIDVIDADVVSCTISTKDAILKTLKENFGDWVITTTGELNRTALRQHVFHNPDALATLNAIMHPAIKQEIFTQLAQTTSPYVILSVPLLFESAKENDKGWAGICQRILVVDVSPALQIQRASHRDGQKPEHIQAIINKQIDRQTRLSQADDIVDNSKDLTHLYQQLHPLHQLYLNLAKQKST